MKIGELSGIPINIHWTWWILFGVIIFPFATMTQLAFNIYVGIMIGLMVLIHEFGHALVAQKMGYTVTNIQLFGLGGLATIPSLGSPTPKMEALITIAGPAANIVIAMLALAIHTLLFSAGLVGAGNTLFIAVWATNFAMGIFNLIPVFPMDGGRLLRAGLSRFYGHIKATRIATTVSFILSGLMAIAAIYFFDPVLLFIAVFAFAVSIVERKSVRHGGIA